MKERKAILINVKRCFNCLKQGHVSKNCRSSAKCYNCKGKHNTALCYKLEKSDEKETSEENPVTTATSKEKSNMLLQTAQTYAYGEDP